MSLESWAQRERSLGRSVHVYERRGGRMISIPPSDVVGVYLTEALVSAWRFRQEHSTRRLASYTGGMIEFMADLSLTNPSGCDRDPASVTDNAVSELLDLCRAGDRAGFDALASCLMPAEQIGECWDGARARLGLR